MTATGHDLAAIRGLLIPSGVPGWRSRLSNQDSETTPRKVNSLRPPQRYRSCVSRNREEFIRCVASKHRNAPVPSEHDRKEQVETNGSGSRATGSAGPPPALSEPAAHEPERKDRPSLEGFEHQHRLTSRGGATKHLSQLVRSEVVDRIERHADTAQITRNTSGIDGSKFHGEVRVTPESLRKVAMGVEISECDGDLPIQFPFNQRNHLG